MLYIFWFRKDLRVVDNRGLYELSKGISSEDKFSFLYIKNKNTFNYFGEKRIAFLIETLTELKEELNSHGYKLQVIEGNSYDVFANIVAEHKAISLYLNTQVEPYCIKRDDKIKMLVESTGGNYSSFTDTTILDLGKLKNGKGDQYKVYSAFKNQALSLLEEKHYKKYDVDLSAFNNNRETILKNFKDFDLDKLYKKIAKSKFIKGGRSEGIKSLKEFYENSLEKYKSKRNFPATNGTSSLSAHLHFGTIGIREVFRTAFNKLDKVKHTSKKVEVQTWIDELLWREFYYNITFHNPQIMNESFRREYDKIKWNNDEEHFEKWCNGMTGFPIVDAGMRQLSEEGWMHNRVRMIVAMFLTKNLLIDWRLGEKYFAENLIDLDFSNNNGGWQWSASTGVDVQPYFRIFNPILQSKKFDSNGDYIKRYIPELSSLPLTFIHQPYLMGKLEQNMYNVIIGKDYPYPIVDHAKARDIAIKEYQSIKR